LSEIILLSAIQNLVFLFWCHHWVTSTYS